jgi:hypothetical protein
MIVGRRSSPVTGLVVAILIPVLFAAGIGIRLWLWPAAGLKGDLDQFVGWVHGIAVNGWANAYDQSLSFPAVMAWVWGALAAVEPAFRTVTDSSDPAIRALMKVPASLADLGIAAAVGWWFRDRPWAAVAAVAAVLLWPVTWYVSAWWGQYESIYVLPAVLAVLAARARRPGLVAVLVAISLMTKPQALPFVVPFAAWFLATQGVRGTIKASIIGLATIAVLWLPFIAAGGPTKYLANLGQYQDTIFGILSVRAWNPWMILQLLGAGGNFVADTAHVAGPITTRHLGYVLAAVLALPVFLGVYRRPTAEHLALGLAAITLVAFVCLTTMHERYSYAAFVFLLMAVRRWSDVALWALVAVCIAANLVWAIPPDEATFVRASLPALVGSVALTLAAILCVVLTTSREEPEDDASGGTPLHSIWPAQLQ